MGEGVEQQEKSKNNGDTGRQIALDTRMRRGQSRGGRKRAGEEEMETMCRPIQFMATSH